MDAAVGVQLLERFREVASATAMKLGYPIVEVDRYLLDQVFSSSFELYAISCVGYRAKLERERELLGRPVEALPF